MALKLSNIENVFAKAGDMITTVKGLRDKVGEGNKEMTLVDSAISTDIDSVDTLNSYLQSLQADASPAVMMALQSQLYVLKYIKSPTMTLMAVDNILACLYKSLNQASGEKEKEMLRETFTSLLQSFIFVAEARLQYEIDTNKEESIRLLADAGDMLMSSVTATATMIVPVVAGAKVGKVLPKMVNVLASNTEQKGFLGRLILAKGKKALIEEKKLEFDKTLNYIFDTLGKYAELIGRSIQMHGMLSRYAEGMIERFASTQYEKVSKQIGEEEGGRLGALVDTSMKLVSASDNATGLKLLFKAVADITKPESHVDYNTIMGIKRTLQSEYKGYQMQIERIDDEIFEVKTEMDNLSIIQFSKKKNLQEQIDKLILRKQKIENIAVKCNQKLMMVDDVIGPVNMEVEQYALKLKETVAKFEFKV